MFGVIGNFGFHKGQIDGQTLKTRVFHEVISKIENENIEYVDTSTIKVKPLKVLISIFRLFKKHKIIFILPGKLGLRFLLPYYIFLAKKYNTKIFYIVIGGWLYKMAIKNRRIGQGLFKLNGIYVETEQMYYDLMSFGLRNVHTLSNFRDFPLDIPENSIEKENPFRCLFLSRVVKEKGIEITIDAIKKLRNQGKNIVLDIYGPIKKKYKHKLLDYTDDIDCINFNGILKPDDPLFYSVIAKYHIIVFPTYYEGEGMSGTILDGYISGVPTISSDWKYNHLVIKDKENGVILKENTSEELAKEIERLYNNRDELKRLKEGCCEVRKNYNARILIKKLLEQVKSYNSVESN